MLNMRATKPVKFTCPKKGHSRYNPEAEGQMGIKSGCHICVQIYTVFAAAMKLRSEARDTSALIDDYKATHGGL